MNSWLRANFKQNFDLDALAADLGISPRHLPRTYHRQAGVMITQKLHEIRIDAATKLLLHEDDISVTAAANAVGYTSLKYFTEAFAREKGQSLSEWVGHRKGRIPPP